MSKISMVTKRDVAAVGAIIVILGIAGAAILWIAAPWLLPGSGIEPPVTTEHDYYGTLEHIEYEATTYGRIYETKLLFADGQVFPLSGHYIFEIGETYHVHYLRRVDPREGILVKVLEVRMIEVP